MLVVVDHRVVVGGLPLARLPKAPALRVRPEVHVRGVHPEEERLALIMLALDEVDGAVDDLVVDRLHPLLRQRAGVLDLLLAAASHPAAKHPTRPEALLEVREVLGVRIVRVLRLLLGVQVVEVAEELVEAVARRQVLVAIPEVILPELAGRVAERLQELRDRRVPGLEPGLGTRQPHLAQPRPVRALARDERRASRGAALLTV